MKSLVYTCNVITTCSFCTSAGKAGVSMNGNEFIAHCAAGLTPFRNEYYARIDRYDLNETSLLAFRYYVELYK